MAEYDVIVIGGGPGGYVCAIRCAQLGLKTACVEGRGSLGGTCLNVGCIPSKALLHATEMLHEAQNNFATLGIDAGAVSVDWKRMLGHKEKVVEANTRGIEYLFRKNGVEWIQGWGQLSGPGRVRVGEELIAGRNIVVATGSEPATLRGVQIDEERIVSSTGALELTAIPERLAVIGAGVIGLELGSVYRRLGSEVTVIEYLDHVTPGMDGELQRGLKRALEKQGLKFVMGAAVSGATAGESGVALNWTARKDGAEGGMEADVVLVATGRRPFTAGLGAESAGLTLTDRGFIRSSHGRTDVPGIWAIGDVTEGPMLAHKAEDEGIAVAETIAGQKGHVNYDVIPSVIYTAPEVAAVGRTEAELKEAGRAYKAGKFQFMANGRAKASLATDGFVKLIADAGTDRLLGAHIMGPAAGELIEEICVAMEFGAAAEDVARTCHAHPTYSEAVREAALACGDGPIHS
ncbi:MAG: dihydrolipoyl dehydrogenase [Alphaproteobacteria bacterium]|nr:MAG: dihydrolipoyl dehydrogenase [Alphaproteobacteria bacterium]